MALSLQLITNTQQSAIARKNIKTLNQIQENEEMNF